MERALYHPKHGYYCQAQPPQGPGGDYITAPTLGPLFAMCLAQTLAPILLRYPDWSIAELGPSDGQLAVHLLSALLKIGACPSRYYLIDPACHLHANRQLSVQKQVGNCYKRMHWCKNLPSAFRGIVLANEVLDALPVHLLQSNGQKHIESIKVRRLDQSAQLVCHRVDPKILSCFHERSLPLYPNYRYEISTAVPHFLSQVAMSIQEGVCLFFDYGYTRSHYYHPQRKLGTLTSFRKHFCLHDICATPGAQDISVHVDFTLVAESASMAGMQVLGFTNQEQFLIANDLPTLLKKHPFLRGQAHLLTSPYEMGEVIKVIALGKKICPDLHLQGFRYGNLRL